MGKSVRLDEKLSALQAIDPLRRWYSLDDWRVCILCDKTITGRMIDVCKDRHGTYEVHCPTPGCPATARDWFYRRPTHPAPWEVTPTRATTPAHRAATAG